MGFDGLASGRFGTLRVAGTCVLLPLQCNRNAGKRLGDRNLHAFARAQFPHLVRAPKKSCASICGRRTSHLRQEAFQRQTRHTKHVILQIILLTSSSKYKKVLFVVVCVAVCQGANVARQDKSRKGLSYIQRKNICVSCSVYGSVVFTGGIYKENESEYKKRGFQTEAARFF